MRTTHFGFCPNCEKETNQIHITDEKRYYVLGGTRVQYDADYFICESCNGIYDNPDPSYDPLAQAYAEYKRITGKEWRWVKE